MGKANITQNHAIQGAPGKQRHFHQSHSRTAHLQDRDKKVEFPKANSPLRRNLHTPYPIVDPTTPTVPEKSPIISGEVDKDGSDGKEPKTREFKKGKATSLAPICRGTTRFSRPKTTPIPTKKIIVVPWAVKIC